jgi:hypothetical protein
MPIATPYQTTFVSSRPRIFGFWLEQGISAAIIVSGEICCCEGTPAVHGCKLGGVISVGLNNGFRSNYPSTPNQYLQA